MKNRIRILVVAAILAWPAVEAYRWHAAEQDLASRMKWEAQVSHRLAMAKQKTVHVAQTPPEEH